MGIYKSSKHSKVKYLGCMPDETMFRKAIELYVINKISYKLKFLFRKNRILNQTSFQLEQKIE